MPGRARWMIRFPRTEVLGLIAVALLAGCAAQKQSFVPLERVHGQTQYGYAQAYYPLQGPTGTFGEVTLWSRGAYPTHDGSTVIHVAIAVHDTSATPIALDPADVHLTALRTRDGQLPDLPAAERTVVTVAPQASAEVVLHFVVPGDVAPGEIEAFALAWAVHGPASVYYQRTPFAEREGRGEYWGPYDRYPCWPYGPYDCSWGPPPPGPYPVIIHHHDHDSGKGGRIEVERRR